MDLRSDNPEPVSFEVLVRSLKERLEAFKAAFLRGPSGPREAIELWERTLELREECERFYRLLVQYWGILNGLLWAHYPEAYGEKIYPQLREGGSGDGVFTDLTHFNFPRRQPRTMLDVAEEIFLSRNNEPLSMSNLVQEMRRKGVEFRAREPAKSLAQTMRNSGRFETVQRGLYHLKQD